MRFLAALLSTLLIGGTASAAEDAVCPNPKQMTGFET